MTAIATLAALDPPRTYDGTQLRSHFILETFGVGGDAIVAFRGPAEVRGAALVDLEDRRHGLFIRSRDMLHILAEHFGGTLETAVLRQRILVLVAAAILAESGSGGLRRSGDDLFAGEGKLSVSIATVSPVSSLIHFGLNIDPAGAPVRAAGLADVGADPAGFAARLLDAYADECARMERARVKVRPVP